MVVSDTMSGGEGINNKHIAILITILAIVVSITSFFFISLLEDLRGGDPYYTEYDYSVTGTYLVDNSMRQCSGTGHSSNISETDANKIYKVKLDIIDSDNVPHNIRCIFMTEPDDVPTSEFTFLGKDGEDHDKWGCSDDSCTYVYHVGKECKIYSIEVKSPYCDIVAYIV